MMERESSHHRGSDGGSTPKVKKLGRWTWWRPLRSLVELMVPRCACEAVRSIPRPPEVELTAGDIVTGTFFGHRNKRVNFCIQRNSRSQPLMLVELPVYTSYLAKEMQGGMVRLALVCNRTGSDCPVWDVPVWTAFCNGRMVGFAISRTPTEEDIMMLKSMKLVSVGAGILPNEAQSEDGRVVYLRAGFTRVTGSADSESFHMVNPAGCTAQQMSIFLMRQ